MKGAIVTAAREGHSIVRNSSFIKQVLVAAAHSRILNSPDTRPSTANCRPKGYLPSTGCMVNPTGFFEEVYIWDLS